MSKKIISVVLLICILFSSASPALAAMTYFGTNKTYHVTKSEYVNYIVPFFDECKNISAGVSDFTSWYDFDSVEDVISASSNNKSRLKELQSLYSNYLAVPAIHGSKSAYLYFYEDADAMYVDTTFYMSNIDGECRVDYYLKDTVYHKVEIRQVNDGEIRTTITSGEAVGSQKTSLGHYIMRGESTSASKWYRYIVDARLAYYYYFSSANIYNTYGELMIQANTTGGGWASGDTDVSGGISGIIGGMFGDLSDHPYLSKILELLERAQILCEN